MYFVIMLLLLLVTNFISSMDSPESQRDEQLIPFNYEVTGRLLEFLLNKTITFDLNLRTRIMLELFSIARGLTNLDVYLSDLCDTEEISSPSGHRVTEVRTEQCKSACNLANVKYVAFLNAAISRVKEQFLGKNASRSHIKLNAIIEITDMCVEVKPKIFECRCNPNYRIMVSTFFQQLVERTVRTAARTLGCKTQEKFVTFVLLLKFSPYAAPLYFSYLIDNEGIFLQRFTYDVPDISDPSVLTTNIPAEEGGIANTINFLGYDMYLFRKLLKKIKCDTCNLKKFGNDHFSNMGPALMFIVLVIAFKKIVRIFPKS